MSEQRLEALGRHVAESSAASRTVSEHEHAELRAAILARAGREQAMRRRPRPRAALGLGLAACALLAAAGLLVELAHKPSALRFEVGSGANARPGEMRAFVGAPEASSLALRFSDGTRVELAPRARARVTALSRDGAELVLEQGSASVHVVPRRGNRWRVSSGPFEVRVTGTRFDVEWQPARDAFALDLREGHVSVSGCGFENGLAVRAGEHLEASCSRRELRVTSIVDAKRASQAAAATAPGRTQAQVEAAGAERAREATPDTPASTAVGSGAHTKAPAEPSARFVELAREGHYDQAYAAALGLEPSAIASAEALLLYADAARLTRHVAQARAAYQALRTRFPRTDAAALAAFYLARIELDERGDAAFRRTLARSLPRGAAAGRARGLRARTADGGARASGQAE